MPQLTISQVARQMGLQPSAIRYYEHIGILLPPERRGGQRRYDATVLYRLAVIQRARQTGFTLDEIRQLFFGFGTGATASRRWQQMSRRKLTELNELIKQMRAMQNLLRKMMACCRCETLDQCGRGIFRSGLKSEAVRTSRLNGRLRRKS